MRNVVLGTGLAAIAGVLAANPTPASAQTTEPVRYLNRVGAMVQLENDKFSVIKPNTDRYYTHGTHFTALVPGNAVQDWFGARIPAFAEAEEVRSSAGFGQNIYTPQDMFTAEPRPKDRPYAGYAYLHGSLIGASAERLDTLELRVGTVGPYSLAGPAQDAVHDFQHIPKAEGWDNQIGNEPNVSVIVERRSRPDAWAAGDPDKAFADITTVLGAEVGTFRVGIDAGLAVRFGWGRPGDYGPSRSWPAPASNTFAAPARSPVSLYGYARAELRAVAFDVTLDGALTEASASVDKRYLVPEAEFGLAGEVRIGCVLIRAARAQVFRGLEFNGQNGRQEFGRWGVSLHWVRR